MPSPTATTLVRCSARKAASSASRDRNETKPPYTLPPAERIGPASPTRCSPATCADRSTPAESSSSRRKATVSATRAGSISSRDSVLPTTCGRSNVSRAKKTTSEPVACLISCASVSLTSYAAHPRERGGATREERLDPAASAHQGAPDGLVRGAMRLQRRQSERQTEHDDDEQRRGEEDLRRQAEPRRPNTARVRHS